MRLVIIAPLLALSVVACGKPAPTGDAPGRTAGPTSQVVLKGSDGQDVTIKAGAAAANVGAGREAPAYAPIYPGATVLSRAETANTRGEVTILRFSTKDPVDKVVAFYRAAVGRAGVPVSADMVMAESVMFAAEEEGGGRGMQLTASGSKSGVTIVQLTYHAPKK